VVSADWVALASLWEAPTLLFFIHLHVFLIIGTSYILTTSPVRLSIRGQQTNKPQCRIFVGNFIVIQIVKEFHAFI
jgi:hypothetical protein